MQSYENASTKESHTRVGVLIGRDVEVSCYVSAASIEVWAGKWLIIGDI